MIQNKFQVSTNEEHLLERHYRLRDLLEEAQNRWLTAEKIYEWLPFFYPWDGKTNFTGSVGRLIAKDVQLINKSFVFQKIIVSHRSKGYKLGTKDECEKYISQQKKELSDRWKRLKEIASRYGLDGQMKIPFEEEPYARDHYEMFVS